MPTVPIPHFHVKGLLKATSKATLACDRQALRRVIMNIAIFRGVRGTCKKVVSCRLGKENFAGNKESLCKDAKVMPNLFNKEQFSSHNLNQKFSLNHKADITATENPSYVTLIEL